MRNSVFLLCLLSLCSGSSSYIGRYDLKEGVIGEKSISKLHIIEIKQMKFIPADLSVNKGDTVRFINNDLVVHDVTEELHKAWTSSPLPVGKSWDLVVTKSAAYFCSLHVVMKGKIVVGKRE